MLHSSSIYSLLLNIVYVSLELGKVRRRCLLSFCRLSPHGLPTFVTNTVSRAGQKGEKAAFVQRTWLQSIQQSRCAWANSITATDTISYIATSIRYTSKRFFCFHKALWLYWKRHYCDDFWNISTRLSWVVTTRLQPRWLSWRLYMWLNMLKAILL